MIYDSNSKQIANHIIKNENYRNSKLYTLEWWNDVAPGSTGYLAKNNIFIYDLHNRKRNSFESIKDIFDLKYEPINFDDFYENMDKNSYLIATGILLNQTFISMLVESKPNGDYIFTTKKRKYHLKLIEKLDFKKVSFYKIYEI